ncbi:SRPBCC domain-containing protein [Streptomyces indicus]|uniref:Uncharacterized conserved protein YndB, AHSA1/START domain n=1 Tax=Streptomyces indicus TaxID=417292 RepID=A0A1G9IY74_9ACTN|nr:SRPBCC domain-containing protein [Streptomyces indicus]SDL30219.1 Uncharacterized conserved protein YndB, AHSA1/START domain [Streptomyces indicus]
MNEPLAYGTLETVDGRPMLRFERVLGHPVERVWQAVSVPAELGKWFPSAVDWKPATGETLDVGGQPLQVTEATPPRRLAWSYAGQPFSFELTPQGQGCRLVFTHVIDDLPAAQTATGWETYLSRLEPTLAGEEVSEEAAHARWTEIHELYAARFGVDPEPGRQWAAANLPATPQDGNSA